MLVIDVETGTLSHIDGAGEGRGNKYYGIAAGGDGKWTPVTTRGPVEDADPTYRTTADGARVWLRLGRHRIVASGCDQCPATQRLLRGMLEAVFASGGDLQKP